MWPTSSSRSVPLRTCARAKKHCHRGRSGGQWQSRSRTGAAVWMLRERHRNEASRKSIQYYEYVVLTLAQLYTTIDCRGSNRMETRRACEWPLCGV